MKRDHFWDEGLMLRSKALLETLKARDLDFVLIGGWGVFLFTRYHMSRDIDFLMREQEIWKLRSYVQARGGREKVAGLKKMGFIINDIGIDVYTEDLSGLAIDIPEVFGKGLYRTIEGYKVLEPGRLILLKLDAVRARGHSLKGTKDRCDVLSLCLEDRTHLEAFMSLVKERNDIESLNRLKDLIKMADIEFQYIYERKPIPSKIKRVKKELLDILK